MAIAFMLERVHQRGVSVALWAFMNRRGDEDLGRRKENNESTFGSPSLNPDSLQRPDQVEATLIIEMAASSENNEDSKSCTEFRKSQPSSLFLSIPGKPLSLPRLTSLVRSCCCRMAILKPLNILLC